MKKKYQMLAICMLCFSLIACGDSMDTTISSFINTVRENEAVEEIALSELTDFEWDEFYVFEPYMSKKEIEEAIGFELDEMADDFVLDDNTTCFMFVKDEKCVGFFNSGAKESKIYFNFGIVDRYLCLENEDNPLFSIEQENEMSRLTYIRE